MPFPAPPAVATLGRSPQTSAALPTSRERGPPKLRDDVAVRAKGRDNGPTSEPVHGWAPTRRPRPPAWRRGLRGPIAGRHASRHDARTGLFH